MAARSNNRGGGSPLDREGPSKRQLRVGSLLQSEIADIIRKGYEVKSEDALEDGLRSRISVVDVECSPDIRFAKVAVSIYGETVEKREAFVWLVDNAKAIRHALSQRLKDMRHVPDISFRQDDLSAGADMFHLLSQLEEDRKMRSSVRRNDGLEVDWSDDEEEDEDDDDDYEGEEDVEEEEEEEVIVPSPRNNGGKKKPQVRRQLQRMQREDDDELWDSDDDDDVIDLYEDDDEDEEEEDEEEEDSMYALQRALGRRPSNSISNRKPASAVFAKAVGRRGLVEEDDDDDDDVLSPFEASLKVGSLEEELANEIKAMQAAGITDFDWSDDEDEDDFLPPPPKRQPTKKTAPPKSPPTAATKLPKAIPPKASSPSKDTARSGKKTTRKPGKATRKSYREGKYS